MLARATFRAASAPTLVARRGFQSTRAQLSSPYHYPEGPRSNLPFDPLKKGFAFKYWGFMGELGLVTLGIMANKSQLLDSRFPSSLLVRHPTRHAYLLELG
ncbi:hypothetical protein J1614_004100 [Plenodomus biglobosus]|nr:hypothetical protein J1614_004100 [Plenodomus biglobosus]